jgi:hypothetical protein
MGLTAAAPVSSSWAQAPSLGTAGSFAVLAGSTVTNTGPTVIDGDVGVSPGSAVTGFPPGIVNGVIHAADAVAGQAQLDNLTAYNTLAGRPIATNLTGQDLGGKTLIAGVYGFNTSASLIGRLGSSTFRLSATAVSMSLTGSRFSSESAPGPFHHGIRGRGGTISSAALPSDERQVQADMRTHLIHRPARDIIPPRGGVRVSSYRI